MSDLSPTAREFALRSRGKANKDLILSPQSQAAIKRQCPNVLISALHDALNSYRYVGLKTPQQTLNDRRDALQRLASDCHSLARALNAVSSVEKERLAQAMSRGSKKKVRLPDPLQLMSLGTEAKRAASGLRSVAGRPMTRKSYVIRDIARELQRTGHAVDASSKGSLVFIAGELFRALGEPVQDVRSLVRNTLAKMDTETLDFSHDSYS